MIDRQALNPSQHVFNEVLNCINIIIILFWYLDERHTVGIKCSWKIVCVFWWSQLHWRMFMCCDLAWWHFSVVYFYFLSNSVPWVYVCLLCLLFLSWKMNVTYFLSYLYTSPNWLSYSCHWCASWIGSTKSFNSCLHPTFLQQTFVVLIS